MTAVSASPGQRVRDVSRRRSRRTMTNAVMVSLLALTLLIALVPLVAVLGYVLVHGIPGLTGKLFTSLPRPIAKGAGGMAQSMVGSLVIVFLGSALGGLIGLAGGVYLAEYGRGRLAWLVRFFADVLSGVPSITIGLFAYVLIVVPLHSFSALAAAVALAILMLPLVVRTTEQTLQLLPSSMREAGLGLGVPQWKVILRVLLPAASGGIATGMLLAVARVAGETAPLLFTAFGNEFWQRSLLKPIDAVPLRLFKYAIGPYPAWHQLAQAASLVLILFVLVISVGARYLARHSYRAEG